MKKVLRNAGDTLREAQMNFMKIGACHEAFIKDVGSPEGKTQTGTILKAYPKLFIRLKQLSQRICTKLSADKNDNEVTIICTSLIKCTKTERFHTSQIC